ncbi:DDE 3 domain-containing protein [Aphis craccivora]|uniref:DDE 3 domain-containing protein n=1 Tax=Aphis craccivora TaxID=307492 RepID=A0A6G0YIF2_APHCR|nr:DDE 3 domain-containing protein [Aphis craccivora]
MLKSIFCHRSFFFDLDRFKRSIYFRESPITNAYIQLTFGALPRNVCPLNTNICWTIQHDYITRVQSDRTRMGNATNTAIERVTKENWENFIRHVIKEEEKIMKVDDIMDDIIDQLEPCILTVSNETSSDDSDFFNSSSFRGRSTCEPNT